VKGDLPLKVRTTILTVILIILCPGLTAWGAQSPDDKTNVDYATLMNQGGAEYRSGHFAAAEKLYLAALRTLDAANERERAGTLTELGAVYVNEDELAKAERAYEESLVIYKRLAAKNPTVLVLRNLGAAYSLQRRDDEALRVLREALKMTKDPEIARKLSVEVLNCLGMVYFRMGKKNKAERFLNQALQIESTSGSPVDNAALLNNLGVVYQSKRDFQRAENLLKQAMKITEAQAGPEHPDMTFSFSALGVLYLNTRRFREAEEQFQRALKILDPNDLALETRIARLLYAVSATYEKAGKKTEAEATLAQAAIIARRHLSNHAAMTTIVDDYSASLKKQGRLKEAEELRVEVKRARVAAGLVISAHNPF
jgi:tetratricopeptide (TPR) repeat protein